MIPANLKNTALRGKRFIRWLQGNDLLLRAQIDLPTLQCGSDYGGWTIVADSLDRDSTVYSFGVGRDVTFDTFLIERYGLTVHAFDPTPRAVRWIGHQSLPEEFIFHPVGISDHDGTAVFRPPANDEHVSYSCAGGDESRESDVEAKVRRLETIMNELGHESVDLLKMDIEGSEYDVIDDLLETGIFPDQLLVEFHHRFPSVNLQQTRDAVERLNSAGYRIFDVSPSGREYAFLHGSSFDR